MTRIEYRVELAPFDEHHDITREELLGKLNELGKDGWRLIAVNPLNRPLGGYVQSKSIPLLLMREVTA